MARKKSSNQFEDSLNKLESIIKKMESGDLTLEESIQQFEEGIALSQSCQKTLDEAEQKIKILMQKNGKDDLLDFDDDQELDET